MSGALTRLALRALGAVAPMTGSAEAAVRPRLPARFAPEAPAPDPLATDESGPAEAAPPARERPSALSTVAPAHVPPPPVMPAPRGDPPRTDATAMQPPAADRSRAPVPPTQPPVPAARARGEVPGVPEHRPAATTNGWDALNLSPVQVAPAAAPQALRPAERGTPPPALLPEAEPQALSLPLAPVPRASLPATHGAGVVAGGAMAPAPPEIVIHIGRIDVASQPPAPQRSPAPAPRRSGLGDYLRGRSPG